MSNFRGPNFGHRCYEMIDPRDKQTRYVGFGAGPAPWTSPRVHVQSDVTRWLAELASAGLTPLLDWSQLPSCFLREDAAKWLARSRRATLVAAGFRVLTGFGPAWRPAGSAVEHLRQPCVRECTD